jgi:antitoxin component of MazEF toxin-antitoxin module
MVMIKKLSAVGNSLALIIEKPILLLLGIDRDTPLEIKTDGEGLTIRPLRKKSARKGGTSKAKPKTSRKTR